MSREIIKQINELVTQAQCLISEAEALADEHNVGFSMNLGGYGMGGYYVAPDEVDEEDRDYHDIPEGQGFWRASSQSC
jgi:hypothetical protein